MTGTQQKRPLSQLEWSFLQALAALSAQAQLPPTLEEIGAAINVPSKGHLSYLRDSLKLRALVAYKPMAHRSLTLTPAGRLYLQHAAKEQIAHGR
jgi:hypothetical protein